MEFHVARQTQKSVFGLDCVRPCSSRLSLFLIEKVNRSARMLFRHGWERIDAKQAPNPPSHQAQETGSSSAGSMTGRATRNLGVAVTRPHGGKPSGNSRSQMSHYARYAGQQAG